MALAFEAGVGARPEALHAHRLVLAVGCLDAPAPRAQGQLIRPGVRRLVGVAERGEAHAGAGERRRLVGRTVVALVAALWEEIGPT